MLRLFKARMLQMLAVVVAGWFWVYWTRPLIITRSIDEKSKPLRAKRTPGIGREPSAVPSSTSSFSEDLCLRRAEAFSIRA